MITSLKEKKLNQVLLRNLLNILICFLSALSVSGCAQSVWFQAIRRNDIEYMKKYIAEGQDINLRGELLNPLNYAVMENNVDILRLLIEKGADVNVRNSLGNTPLYHTYTAEITQLLLRAGADVNTRNNKGETPLHWAKTGEVVKILMEEGAEVNPLNNEGETPLDEAARLNKKFKDRGAVIAVLQDFGGKLIKYKAEETKLLAKNDHMRAMSAMTQGRPYDAIAYYSEMVKKVRLDKIEPIDLMQIWHAYMMIRDYRNEEIYAAEWDRRANTGDGSYSQSPNFASSIVDSYIPFSITGQAERLIRNGNYQGAIEYLENYLNKDGQFDFSKYRRRAKVMGKVVMQYTYSPCREYVMLIYAYLKTGDENKARHYLAVLENYLDTGLKVITKEDIEASSTIYKNGPSAQCSQEEIFDYVYLNNLITEEGYLIGLEEVYLEMKEYDKALHFADKLKDAQNRKWCVLAGKTFDFPYMALTLPIKRAHLLFKAGRYAESKKAFQEQLANPKLTGFSDFHRLILFDLGLIALQEKDQTLAIDYFKQAIEVIESQRKTIDRESARISFAGDKQAVYKQLVATLIETGRDGEAFSYAERGKARALIDMLAYKEDIRMKNDDSGQAKALLEEINTAEFKALAANSGAAPPQASSASDKTRGITLTARQDIAAADPEFASLITVTPPDVATLQSLLPAGETLVEYYGFDDDLFVFVVDKDEVRGLKLDATGIDQEVKAFRTSLLAPPEAARGIKAKDQAAPPRQELRAASAALYRRLFTPIEGMIKNGNVTIVPHGSLHYLPFNALYTGQEYVLDKFHLRVLPSAGVMQFLQAKSVHPAGNLLAIGNPDLGDPKLDLPGAEEEARAIAGKIPKTKLFTRGEATETTVKNLSSQYRYLHLATHGTFDAAHPLSSGLYMAKDGTNDGILSVGELYELSIPADLVTLSACETGLGKVANGDDVVGFTRGFLYAGTSSIVSSLWQVDDQATSILMQNFYDNLQKEDKREALREAQLHVMSTYNADPYYWAAFQLTGAVQ